MRFWLKPSEKQEIDRCQFIWNPFNSLGQQYPVVLLEYLERRLTKLKTRCNVPDASALTERKE